MRVHPVFHISLLEPAPKNTPFKTQLKAQTDQNIYDIETILDSCQNGPVFEYLIKWEGYSHDENTWEPRKHLENCGENVEQFHRQNPDRPRPKQRGQPRKNQGQQKISQCSQ
ncbi:Uu.00g120390.m01.CDS01 [Anthostomella pinea]|uniref:Uu.00g120390.m01.CDS01 n=1 Tax=Anthostomella pinea TaxID=933095 RepID=A0AAI8VHS1_9PEZI|nr:Uu.00g120390.m01.CDS01 [Anthostomella pinea]